MITFIVGIIVINALGYTTFGYSNSDIADWIDGWISFHTVWSIVVQTTSNKFTNMLLHKVSLVHWWSGLIRKFKSE